MNKSECSCFGESFLNLSIILPLLNDAVSNQSMVCLPFLMIYHKIIVSVFGVCGKFCSDYIYRISFLSHFFNWLKKFESSMTVLSSFRKLKASLTNKS